MKVRLLRVSDRTARVGFPSRRERTMLTKNYLWTTALLAASAITLALTYSGIGTDGCDPVLTHVATVALLIGTGAVALLAYTLFLVVKSRPLAARRWRYVLGVPVALMAAWAVFAAGTFPIGLADTCP